MRTVNRKAFIRGLISAVGWAAFPFSGESIPAATLSFADRSRSSAVRIDDFGIIDLHCHPSLKMYLWNEKIWRKYHPTAGMNPIWMQVTTDELSSGYVKGLLVAHYLVEAALTRESAVLKEWFPWIKLLFHSLSDKVEHEDASNFDQINHIIDEMEYQVFRANGKQNRVQLVITKNFAEFEQAIQDGKIPIAHAIEGAHALGRNFPLTLGHRSSVSPDTSRAGSMGDDPTRYIENLEKLKRRGVCLMTIAHIFQNDIAYPTEGISPDGKRGIRMAWTYVPCRDNRPLTQIGEAVVQRMLDIGMVVDLTHSTPAARQQVFAMNCARRIAGKPVRPLAFTHTGAQGVFEQYDKRYNRGANEDYKYYDACDLEIDQICGCNGVIGIIPENFWLLGCDPALDKQNAGGFRDGIEYMVETIIYINGKTRSKDYDNISIGTDFDGFADAPADLYKPSQLGALIQRLRAGKLTDQQIKKITSLNALRLLREGWT
jgi:microsomal dipeptidase-like Zn-dependent dipeptidase